MNMKLKFLFLIYFNNQLQGSSQSVQQHNLAIAQQQNQLSWLASNVKHNWGSADDDNLNAELSALVDETNQNFNNAVAAQAQAAAAAAAVANAKWNVPVQLVQKYTTNDILAPAKFKTMNYYSQPQN